MSKVVGDVPGGYRSRSNELDKESRKFRKAGNNRENQRILSNILIPKRTRTSCFRRHQAVRTIIQEKSKKRWKNGTGRTSTLDSASRRRARLFPDNIDCDDDTATLKLGANPRADRLLNAENVVLEHENRRKEKENSDDAVKKEKEEGKNENYQNRAAVLRLAGLYHSLRGAHTYFMKAGTIESRPDALGELHTLRRCG